MLGTMWPRYSLYNLTQNNGLDLRVDFPSSLILCARRQAEPVVSLSIVGEAHKGSRLTQ